MVSTCHPLSPLVQLQYSAHSTESIIYITVNGCVCVCTHGHTHAHRSSSCLSHLGLNPNFCNPLLTGVCQHFDILDPSVHLFHFAVATTALLLLLKAYFVATAGPVLSTSGVSSAWGTCPWAVT